MNESAQVSPKAKTSRLAVWSMRLGIVGLISACVLVGLPLALIGLILGIVALVQIGKPGRPGMGKGYAVAGVVISATTMVVGPLVLLPAMGAYRRAMRGLQYNMPIRGIQQSMIMWAKSQPVNPQTGNRPMPDHIWTLLEQNYFNVEYLTSPFSNDIPPEDFDTLPPHQQHAWVCAHSAFVVVPHLEDDRDENTIAVFGKPDHFEDRGIPVAYNDDQARWQTDVQAIDRQLQAQTGKSMAELIAQSEAYP